MLEYNIVYFFVWVLALLSYDKNLNYEFLFRIQSLIIIFFSALRFQTGYDWPVYEEHYNSVSAGADFNLKFEFGYEYIVRIFSFLGVNFQLFSFIIGFVQVVFIVKSIKVFFPKNSIIILAVMYSLSDFYLIPVFSLMRQGMAVSLFFFGLACYFHNRNKLAYVFFILAISFHYSTIFILLIIFLLFNIQFKRRDYLFFFAISIVTYLFSLDVFGWVLSVFLPILGEKYTIYLNRDVYNASVIYRVCYSIAMTFFFYGIYWSYQNDDNRINSERMFSRKIYALAFMGVIIPLALYAFPTVSTRFQYFFSIFTIGICLQAYAIFKKTNHLLITLILAIVFYVPFYRFLVDPLSLVYIPYQSQIFYNEVNSTGKVRTAELLNKLYYLWSKK